MNAVLETKNVRKGNSMEKNCANCRHWQGVFPNSNLCYRLTPGYGEYDAQDYLRIGSNTADVFTAPDFGCSLFERKGEE